MQLSWRDHEEWLETDGLGGFASGTVGGIRTRRYHGLLTVARRPPVERCLLVNGIETHVECDGQSTPLSSQHYGGDVIHPEGFKRLIAFRSEPWPTWVYELPGGRRITHELFAPHESPMVVLRWWLDEPAPCQLRVRPLLSGRDLHALHQENSAFRWQPSQQAGVVRWEPYPGLPGVLAFASGSYAHAPLWYRRFFYQEEASRGFDATEDLASPGEFSFELARGPAVLMLAAHHDRPINLPAGPVQQAANALRRNELQRRSAFASPLHRAGDQYLVRRGNGRSIIAGYPWFGDWGRDTFIAMRGLCLSTDRLEDARQILLAWAPHISGGMLPNRFPDNGGEPEYNSVDAALWFAIACFDYLDRAERLGQYVPLSTRQALLGGVDRILEGYACGTRHGIRLDEDGLLRSGEPGVQLTWMDARVDGREVTPRAGKPVEVQALWLNVLKRAGQERDKWRVVFETGLRSFRRRFWCERTGCLFDVIDMEGRSGWDDATVRPNQVFAVGGLPLVLLESREARLVVDGLERTLWTPMGLRSLAPHESGYAARYTGGPSQRDAIYHQGTVWPWLAGPFVEAWVRVHGATDAVRAEARRRFVEPLLTHLRHAGLGHISEIADAEAPHMPRGCPFQAWSVGELLRLEQDVLRPQEAVHAVAPKPVMTARHPIVGRVASGAAATPMELP
jgi:predicted glycogen debranching enzyme